MRCCRQPVLGCQTLPVLHMYRMLWTLPEHWQRLLRHGHQPDSPIMDC